MSETNNHLYPFYDFDVYQEAAYQYALANVRDSLQYAVLGLVGEAGEIANKVKKISRDGRTWAEDDVLSELGDVLWYLSLIAEISGIALSDVVEKNLDKLRDRTERGVISGEGDNR